MIKLNEFVDRFYDIGVLDRIYLVCGRQLFTYDMCSVDWRFNVKEMCETFGDYEVRHFIISPMDPLYNKFSMNIEVYKQKEGDPDE